MQPREIALEFLRLCARGEVDAAFKRHVADDFVHHNPWFAHDRESLRWAMAQAAAAEPDKAFEPKQVVDGGDRIAVLSRLRRPAAGVEMAVMHLLRFEGGRIIELWDVGQQVPADSPNALGPF